jgi:rod shape determining protein RodA
MLFSSGGGEINARVIKQFLYIAFLFPVALFMAAVHPHKLYKSVYWLYLLLIIMLLGVAFFGQSAMGAKRWIGFGSMKFQPSEFAKIVLIITLAKYFYQASFQKIQSYWALIFITILVVIPFVLIAMQPDLTTAMICLFLSVIIMFVAGIRKRVFAIAMLAIITSTPIIWSKLHEYQKLRVVNFLHPENDPLGSGYNIIQSKIAIGSGGIFGNGILNGGQSQLSFLPENQTDFIFTVLAEETGLLGCILVLSMYLIVIMYGIMVANMANSFFNKIIAIGSSSFFFLHIAINACMTTGIIPVAGIPMPMLSYGGSSVLSSMLCFGMILHADLNKSYQH